MHLRSLFPLILLWPLVACGSVIGGDNAPPPSGAQRLVYDGAITLSIRSGSTLPGTTIAYQGRAPDGRAILTLSGLQALKSTADSVTWSGSVLPKTTVTLNLRVLTYDDAAVNLGGTIHLEILDPNPQPGEPSPNLITGYSIPVTYNVPRAATIPGSVVIYMGEKPEGAEFANLDQYPYRQRFDSVVWQGRVRDKIALRLDLRVLNYNADAVLLGGIAKVMFEQ